MTGLGDVLGRAWAVLAPPTRSELSSYRLELPFHGVPTRVALDRAGFRHLLIAAGEETVSPQTRPSTLRVGLRRLTFEGEPGHNYLDIACVEPDLYSEFDELITDVFEHAVGEDRPAAAVLRTIARWRRLFGAAAFRGLTIERERGLFGELALLRAVVDRNPNMPLAMWTGPDRQPHDFEFSSHCVEIKAGSAHSDAVTIHGLDQLESHGGRTLVLACLLISEDPDGTSVQSLADHIGNKTPLKAQFRDLLARAGWTARVENNTDRSFLVDDVIRMTVHPDTPRLVPSSLATGELPEGVTALTYMLALDAVRRRGSSVSLTDLAEELV